MTDTTKYLFYAENEIYTIKIYLREGGHTRCFFKIGTDDIHDLYEASNIKLFLRLTYTLNLYKDEFNENQISSISNDLEEISKVLKISENYAKPKNSL